MNKFIKESLKKFNENEHMCSVFLSNINNSKKGIKYYIKEKSEVKSIYNFYGNNIVPLGNYNINLLNVNGIPSKDIFDFFVKDNKSKYKSITFNKKIIRIHDFISSEINNPLFNEFNTFFEFNCRNFYYDEVKLIEPLIFKINIKKLKEDILALDNEITNKIKNCENDIKFKGYLLLREINKKIYKILLKHECFKYGNYCPIENFYKLVYYCFGYFKELHLMRDIKMNGDIMEVTYGYKTDKDTYVLFPIESPNDKSFTFGHYNDHFTKTIIPKLKKAYESGETVMLNGKIYDFDFNTEFTNNGKDLSKSFLTIKSFFLDTKQKFI